MSRCMKTWHINGCGRVKTLHAFHIKCRTSRDEYLKNRQSCIHLLWHSNDTIQNLTVTKLIWAYYESNNICSIRKCFYTISVWIQIFHHFTLCPNVTRLLYLSLLLILILKKDNGSASPIWSKYDQSWLLFYTSQIYELTHKVILKVTLTRSSSFTDIQFKLACSVCWYVIILMSFNNWTMLT